MKIKKIKNKLNKKKFSEGRERENSTQFLFSVQGLLLPSNEHQRIKSTRMILSFFLLLLFFHG